MTITYKFNENVESVYINLTDPEFLKARCEALGEIKVTCNVEEHEGEKTVVLDRTIRRDLPKILAKMFNPENRTVMTEKWIEDGDSYRGSYEIEVHGQPVSLYADFSLEPLGEGSVYKIEHRCKARIPVVGKHVEKFVLGQIADGFNREMDILAEAFE